MADVYPVVAGTDGSVRAGAAVTQAAAEAQRRDLPLRLVYGFAPLYGYAGLDPTPPPDILESCQDVLDAEQERIEKAFPGLAVTTEVAVADPSVALVSESNKATIVYLGARGLGAVRRLLLGSVSSKVAAHSKCPVVVVRGNPGDARGPVVVGMAPEGGSQEAVQYAFEEARRRGTSVRVIQSQQHAAANFDTLPETAMRSMVGTRMQQVAERGQESFEKVTEDYPDVDATLDLSMLHAVDALLEASNDACLTVVGSHGAGAMAAQLLGSVTHGVLTGAPVVAVIPKDI
ncbi:MAG: universal stress protein [Ancrocorticia sp.]|uniref:universal stress protein n=1 Tax=Ancrocorticia sp. TaxID=2593684 RepID=UPI003F93E88D